MGYAIVMHGMGVLHQYPSIVMHKRKKLITTFYGKNARTSTPYSKLAISYCSCCCNRPSNDSVIYIRHRLVAAAMSIPRNQAIEHMSTLSSWVVVVATPKTILVMINLFRFCFQNLTLLAATLSPFCSCTSIRASTSLP